MNRGAIAKSLICILLINGDAEVERKPKFWMRLSLVGCGVRSLPGRV
jgi:hypothetical protein